MKKKQRLAKCLTHCEGGSLAVFFKGHGTSGRDLSLVLKITKRDNQAFFLTDFLTLMPLVKVPRTVPNFRYLKRTFLRPPSSQHGAYILAQVESSVRGSHRNTTNIITIADCKRVIELDFYLGTASDRRASLATMDLLMKVFGEFRRGLRAEAALLQKADQELQKGLKKKKVISS